MDQELINQMVGKTVESVETDRDYPNSLVIHFTDGSKIEIVGRGSDEGGWLETR